MDLAPAHRADCAVLVTAFSSVASVVADSAAHAAGRGRGKDKERGTKGKDKEKGQKSRVKGRDGDRVPPGIAKQGAEKIEKWKAAKARSKKKLQDRMRLKAHKRNQLYVHGLRSMSRASGGSP